jgi:hypothetical protein
MWTVTDSVGWHNLTEDKYLEKKAAYEARKADKAA